jgi:hypothetical protein
VNSAQTNVDAARSTLDAAVATLLSDTQQNLPAATLASDVTAVAAAKAKLEIAQQVLDRARTTSQVVAANAAAGTIASTTGPTMGTLFGQPTWNTPTLYSLPEKFGPVLFEVNDWMTDGKDAGGKLIKVPHVALRAVTSEMGGTASAAELQKEVNPNAQRVFETASTALGPPSLLPSDQVVPLVAKQATFFFDRPIKNLDSSSLVTTDAQPPVPTSAKPIADSSGKSITVDVTQLKPGPYVFVAKFSYVADSLGNTMPATRQVKFTVK